MDVRTFSSSPYTSVPTERFSSGASSTESQVNSGGPASPHVCDTYSLASNRPRQGYEDALVDQAIHWLIPAVAGIVLWQLFDHSSLSEGSGLGKFRESVRNMLNELTAAKPSSSTNSPPENEPSLNEELQPKTGSGTTPQPNNVANKANTHSLDEQYTTTTPSTTVKITPYDA